MVAPRFFAAVPTRLASSRLPGKPLADLGGRSLVLRVVDAVRRTGRLDPVVVTDAPEIAAHVSEAGGAVLFDPRPARTGSDRIAAVLGLLGDPSPLPHEVVINVQGDQPGLSSDALNALVDHMVRTPRCPVATLAAPLAGDVDDPARVKVVVDHQGRALYFSRAPVPHNGPHRVHLGVYAFRVSALRRFAALPTGVLEASESLEQLRLLEHGVRIDVLDVPDPWASIDTPADLLAWRRRNGPVG